MAQEQIRSEAAESYTWGVEIECFMPRHELERLQIMVGHYHHGCPLPSPFPAGWTAERDGSLRTRRPGYVPVEIVSPILRGRAGIEQVKRVAQTLRGLEATVNHTCGLHVHIGMVSAVGPDHAAQAEWVGKLLYHTAMHERALYASTGTHNRENGMYCRSVDGDKATADSLRQAPKSRKGAALERAACGQRHRSINLTNLLTRKATVEFRWAAGTVEWVKVLGHVQTCLALAQKATEPAQLDWHQVASERMYKRAGEGARALDRMLYLMGWTKGRRHVGKPQLEMAGWIADLEDLRPVKTEMKRLARKYDRAA